MTKNELLFLGACILRNSDHCSLKNAINDAKFFYEEFYGSNPDEVQDEPIILS